MKAKELFDRDKLLMQLTNNRTTFLESILEADKPLYERKGHVLQKHLESTPERMLNRLLMENKSAVSTFQSLDVLYSSLEEVLRKNIDAVVDIQNGNSRKGNFREIVSLPISGVCIKADLHEYTAPMIDLFIKHEPDSAYGFYVETIYSRDNDDRIEHPLGIPTGRYYTNQDVFYGIGINREVNPQVRWYLEHEKGIRVRQVENGNLYVDIRKRKHCFQMLIKDGEIQKYIRTIPGGRPQDKDSVRADDVSRRSQQLLKEFRKECPELQQIKEDIAEFVRSLKAHERGYDGMSLHKVETSVDQEQYQNYMREVLRAKGELELPIYNGFDRARKLYLFEQPVILNGIIHASIDDIANPEARAIAEEYCAILFSDDSLNDGTPFLGNGNELQGIPPDMYDEIMMEHNRSLIQQEGDISEQDQDLYQSNHVHISRSDDIDLGDER